VVGKFVEFYGPGLAAMTLADRATIANMAPEYGATCGIFPVDAETLRYLELTGRPREQIALVEAYCKAQGIFHTPTSPDPIFSETLELDLSQVEPSLAGPKRPQDRVPLHQAKPLFRAALASILESRPGGPKPNSPQSSPDGQIGHGSVVIAAITSCTNTSNPSVMIASALLAKKAVERGLSTKPWVKASLAPGSQVVTEYLKVAGLTPYLDQLRFNTVGFGCTTCIGNSGPLPSSINQEIKAKDLVAVAVLSGNRNFEGRINPAVQANYLASPPLVVAYAIAGTMDIDLYNEPLGLDPHGKPVFLHEIWPTQAEIQETIARAVRSDLFRDKYASVFAGNEAWRSLPVPLGDLYVWDEASTYVKQPPYFLDMPLLPQPVVEISRARVLAMLGDSITTDHISPAGSIKKDSPAGQYLMAHGVQPQDFNSYGSRRGNHEVMVRGTFANVRLRNQLAPGTEGGYTRHLPDGVPMTIFEASEKYANEGVPLLVLAGKEYGSGSSRDWAAKGPRLLGVKVVIAESFERIHRSNLIGMGILPLQFEAGLNAASLGLTGEELYNIRGLADFVAGAFAAGRTLTVVAERDDGVRTEFPALVRIDTPQEARYFEHGGILPYVLRQLLVSAQRSAPAEPETIPAPALVAEGAAAPK
jgi:aconitate hydratase